MKSLAFLLVLLTFSILAAEEPLRDLGKIEAALKESPDDPLLHYRKCQALFATGKEQEAINHAAIAMEKFKAQGSTLAWLKLGSIKTENHQLDVHFNMGEKERAEEKDGIVRPYSFRIFAKEGEFKLLQILDFELAYFDGKLVSAAIGETTREGHANYGIVDPKSDFATIKKQVLEILEK